MRFLLIINALIILLVFGNAAADPRLPENPAGPAVDDLGMKNKNGNQSWDFPARLISAKGEKRSGSLMLAFDSIEISVLENGTMEKRKMRISGIDSVDFMEWKGKALGNSRYAFYPSRIRFTLRDGKSYECERPVGALNKLLFKNARGIRAAYTFFYDRRKNDAWQNSGRSEM